MVNQNSPASNHANCADFVPHAAYYEALDCIEYVKKDCTVIAERIDELLTLYRQNNSQAYVGFKIKGFRNYFETTLRPHYGLSEDDFPTLTRLMKSVCEDRAVLLTSDLDSTVKAKSAYDMAYRLASERAVELSGFGARRAA